MVVFSILLLLVVIFRQQGLMGKKEFSWNFLFKKRIPGAGSKGAAGA
jgi:branched-chain amino acid transport system permease protein